MGALLITLIIMDLLAAVFGAVTALTCVKLFIGYVIGHEWDYAVIAMVIVTASASISAYCIRDLVGGKFVSYD
ncbi:hypothetical protein [Lacticaseibacillus saniviri]|uniref:Uncharacterized protein n=2 Tax=Lacticaseibacillus saniviri TaxID=931533 RepID=A0A0R2MUC5_9LACO|nr:hypothetical protein [Lacticaseibacillus saniviri]KRO15883.1 hypothetical protein IV56_GL002073 [Lacticaseibacillus saniviri JCM 17471 = DSM 24301]